MGTTGHPVRYFELDSTEKIKNWLKDYYTWEKWEVLDLARDSKTTNDWWFAMRERETGRVRAQLVATSNRAKREGMFYTKEGDESVGLGSLTIPKKIWALLTPLDETDNAESYEWRKAVLRNA
jgi:hypothetical protein